MRDERFWGIYLETFPALLISGLFALIPGFFLSLYSVELSKIIGLLTLIPAIIGMRGNVFGSFCAHMSSLHHVSTYNMDDHSGDDNKGQKQDRDDELAGRRTGAIAEVLILSIILPLLSFLVFYGLNKPIAPFGLLLFICITSGVSSGVILLSVSMITVRMVRENGLDPDNIAPPVVTTLGDVITLPLISFCSIVGLTLNSNMLWGVNVLGVVTMIVFLQMTKAYSSRIFYSTLFQRLPVLIICLVLSSIAGLAVEEYLIEVSPSYLFFIPLINAQGGNSGSIFASRISSSLYIISADFIEEKNFSLSRNIILSKERITEVASVIFSMICVFLFIGIIVIVMSVDQSWKILLVFFLLAICLGLVSEMVSMIMTLFSIFFGMNPDNIVIACVCAFMDLFGTYCYGALLLVTGLM